MKAQDDTMKKLVILIVGLLVIQMLVGTMVAGAAPGAPCPGPSCGTDGYAHYPNPAYFPYQGLSSGYSPPVYYKYTYCSGPGYQPYVPAFHWWEYPYYPGCGTYWDRLVR